MRLAATDARSEPWFPRLALPAYRITEAARYVGVPPATLARWSRAPADRRPALAPREPGEGLSYLHLVEAAYVASFRARGVNWPAIRRARCYLVERFGSEFPFAAHDLAVAGPHIFLELPADDQEGDDREPLLVAADRGGQHAMAEAFAERVQQFRFEFGLALQWHPRGPDDPVVIDPRLSFGQPVVEGVPTWVLAGHYRAGDSIALLARSFSIGERDVQAALRFEGALPAAA